MSEARSLERGMRRLALISSLAAFTLMGAACGAHEGRGGAEVAATPGASWSWGEQLPGSANLDALSFQARTILDAAARISPEVIPGSGRYVITAGPPPRDMALVAARAHDGATCLTFVTGATASEFSCLGRDIGSGALVRFVRDGGTRIGTVEWVTLVGLTRSDVARVTLVTAAGAERELSLNEWRAFGFSTASKVDFPAAVRAYAADGSVIEELPTFP
jgi:hypothetical protein